MTQVTTIEASASATVYGHADPMMTLTSWRFASDMPEVASQRVLRENENVPHGSG